MTNTEKIVETISKSVLAALKSEDEDRMYLAKNLIQRAYSYTEYRLRWTYLSVKEKKDEDPGRTMSHNAFIDALNMFLRYEKKLGNDVPSLDEYDRKELGDIGNLLIAQIAISQR